MLIFYIAIKISLQHLKIKDTQEKDFMTNIYVTKMSVVTSSVSHLLKEQDYLHKTLQKVKEKNLTNLEEQKSGF